MKPKDVRVLRVDCDHSDCGKWRVHLLEDEWKALSESYDRIFQDRYDLLTVHTKEGMLASEWVMRTATAERERDELHQALRETLAALGNGSAATPEASVAFIANTPNEVRAVVDDLRRERDDYKAKLDAELPAAWREDVESLDRLNERLCWERDEARAELAFIQAEYAAANESDLTRDALCLQLAALRHELRMANERAAIACRERAEAVALNQAMGRVLADKKKEDER